MIEVFLFAGLFIVGGVLFLWKGPAYLRRLVEGQPTGYWSRAYSSKTTRNTVFLSGLTGIAVGIALIIAALTGFLHFD